MIKAIETTRKCRCCGIEQDINNFDLAGNRRPVHVCRRCRYAQQTVSNLRNVPAEDLTIKQADRLQGAKEWLETCRQNTGYVTNTRGTANRVDFRDPQALVAVAVANKKQHEERVAKAIAIRTAFPDKAQPLNRAMIEACPAELLAESGFTYNEVYDWIVANIPEDDPMYEELIDKSLHVK